MHELPHNIFLFVSSQRTLPQIELVGMNANPTCNSILHLFLGFKSSVSLVAWYREPEHL